MGADTIDEAITEARRRAEISDRDVSGSVAHFAGSVRVVCDHWNLTATGWFTEGAGPPTLAVTRPNGIHGVLKLTPPGQLDVPARVMRAAEGNGYARVLDWDSAREALLTERLGESLWQHSRDLAAQSDVVVSALVEAWRVPLDRGSPFTGKALGLRSILDNLGERYGSGHPDAVRLARRYTSELARSERPEVVCHGDPHPGNVLRRDTGWALIDPDGPDPERVWAWAFVERVTTGLFLWWHGYYREADIFLSTADVLARSMPRV